MMHLVARISYINITHVSDFNLCPLDLATFDSIKLAVSINGTGKNPGKDLE